MRIGNLKKTILQTVTVVMALATLLGQAHAATHAVETANGLIKIPDHVQRVITLDETALDVALSVGIEPIGTLATRGGTGVAPYLQEHLQGEIALLGSVREPNLEAILRSKPDLILAPVTLSKMLYQKLSKIAPTIQPQGSAVSGDWQSLSRTYAAALNKTAALEEKLKSIDQQLNAYRKQTSPPLHVSIVRWNPQGPIVMSSQLFAGQMLTQAGFKSIALAEILGEKPHSDTLSLENLAQADGDWLLLATLNEDGAQALAQAKQQPAFLRLSAVKNNQVLAVDGQVWSSGSGPLAANIVLQDLKRIEINAE